MADYIKNEYTTDVLVVGGGIAAVFAAIKAKENGSSVTLVDKGSVGRSGQTPFAAAMAVFDKNNDDRDTWQKIMAENAKNLNNPAYLEVMMDYSEECYEELAEWGATDVGFGAVMRNKILSSGIEVIERTMITTLLEDNGKIVGAVGFKLDSEEATVFMAKSVVLCTGAGGFKPNGFQICSLTFDGDAMAYRIGAKISGKEFTDTHYTLADNPAYCWGQWQGMWSRGLPATGGPIEGGGQALDLHEYTDIHANGVSLSTGQEGDSEQGGPPQGESGEGGERPEGPPEGEDESGEGKGGPPQGESEGGERPSGGGGGGGQRNTVGGASAGLSVHKAEGLFPSNNKCASNIDGLYAAGDCLSSMLVGPLYNGVGGFSISGSATQGVLAGIEASKYAKQNAQISISNSKIESALEEMFEPLTNETGYSPSWVEHMLQGTLIPYYVLYIKEETRLKSALTSIEFFRDHFAVKLNASDMHDLRKAHEVKNMILNAEMKLKSSLFRTESRGNHYREDYPDSNDNDWLAWVVMQKGNDGDMQLEKFMIEDFKKLVV